MNIATIAKNYAAMSYNVIDHKRKYTNEPYIKHPERVAYLVECVGGDDNMIATAWMHDILEDVAPKCLMYSEAGMRDNFGDDITDMVVALSDVSKPSDGNRETRKAIDREHLSNASARVKTIKLADLIDNSLSIVKYDKDFAKIYLKEKDLLLPFLKEGNNTLYNIAHKILCDSLLLIYL